MLINLSGKWTLSEKNTKKKITIDIPGDNYSALLANKIIEDPYYRDNEKITQWPANKDWVFEKKFQVNKKLLDQDKVFLQMESIDTIADIYLNEKKIGQSKNMFVAFEKEVKSFLKIGNNTIKVAITSSVKVGKQEAEKLAMPIPMTGNVTFANQNLIRKVHCHGGWDWGISQLMSGLYGKVQLQGVNRFKLNSVYTEQNFQGKNCELTVIAEVESFVNGSEKISIELNDTTYHWDESLKIGKQTISKKLLIKNVELWWPHGYGEQYLYSLKVSFAEQVVRKKIGIRKLEVINKKDKVGKSLVFRVNGVDIFCKGANWIPCDAFATRQTNAVIDDLLNSSVEAKMNMIRVWGGGQYEADYFYERCDELGIMIWHDLMFACSLYPSNEEFLKNVGDELDYQIKRLRDYVAIVLWCGDNEVIGALTWYKESKANRDSYLVNYDRLNRFCGLKVEENDPTRVFWPSSPCAGPNDFSDTFHADNCGDMHYWRVWHGGIPLEGYYQVTPRFCSEFGFQSFCSFELIKTFTKKEDWNVTTPVMEAHQKNPSGNQKIVNMFSQYFRMPSGFENFVYLSQVQQAIAIKIGVEYWRQLKPICMGTIFWQLNDNWPVASWSSIEYGGRWKQLHYHARRFFSPMMCSAFIKDNKAQFSVVNDTQESQILTLTIRIIDFQGKKIKSISIKKSCPKGGVKSFASYDLANWIKMDINSVFISTELKKGSSVLHENTLFLTEYKKCELADAKIKCQWKKTKDQITLELKADKPAFFVNLEYDDPKVRFSDNSFTLLKDQKKIIKVTGAKNIDIKKVTIKHLRETY